MTVLDSLPWPVRLPIKGLIVLTGVVAFLLLIAGLLYAGGWLIDLAHSHIIVFAWIFGPIVALAALMWLGAWIEDL